MTVGVLVGLIIGGVLGFLSGVLLYLHRRSELIGARQADAALLADARAALDRTGADLDSVRQRARELEIERVRLATDLEHARQGAAERDEAWDSAREHLVNEFARLSHQALASNNEQFLSLADARLKESQQASSSDLSLRQQAIETMVRPLHVQLERYENELRNLERMRNDAYRDLVQKVQELDTTQKGLERETRNLASALRSPTVRGRWGELQLRKVVEMAGMLQHCDFELQLTTSGVQERLRPDMVVHLPGDRHVVVDAKVPLEAFQRAVESEDDEERRSQFIHHARQVRSHIEALAKKEYWKHFGPSPEFVVAFIPGDPLLSVAFEQDPGLIDFAVANHVLPATPTTLISLLWAVAYGWRQDALAENAREIQRLGSELYQRLSTMGDHVVKLGRTLGSSIEAYNAVVGSLESRVLVTARKFPELGVPGSDKGPPELEQVEVTTRRLQSPELGEAEVQKLLSFRTS